jgi:chromate transport protein ChrA
MKFLKPVLLTLLVVAVYLLHQDFWNWKRATPLIFGFLPIGLAYHAAYSILAALTMAVLVKFAWPKHLEDAAEAGRIKDDAQTH